MAAISLFSIDLTRLDIEAAHHVAALDCEPDVFFALVEDQRVWIACRFIRHHDLFDFLRRGIVAADQAVEVSGVPDDAVGAHDQIVRSRTVFQFNLHEFAGLCIEMPEIPCALAYEPD
jgi:hypothetical protein